MKVEQSHHIDASDPENDGMYDWYYEYDIFRFTDGERTLIARSYVDSGDEAHFLRFEEHGKFAGFPAVHLKDPLLWAAVLHLLGTGKTELKCLGRRGSIPHGARLLVSGSLRR